MDGTLWIILAGLLVSNSITVVIWHRAARIIWSERIAAAIEHMPARHEGLFSTRDPLSVRRRAASIARGEHFRCMYCDDLVSRKRLHTCKSGSAPTVTGDGADTLFTPGYDKPT